jgi:hypothetical protein
MHPSRDVVVEYQTTGNTGGPPGQAAPQRVRMYFADHGMKMRMEGEGQPGYVILDRSANRMTMVMVQQHMYMDVPYDPKRVMAFDNPEGTFTRRGTETVAGYSCTVYDAQTPQHRGQVCVTSDGVLLHARREDPNEHGELTAISVTYGAQPPDLFMPPPGFQQFDASHMGHGMGPMGPGGPPQR